MEQSKVAIYIFCTAVLMGIASCEEELVKFPPIKANDKAASDLMDKLVGNWTVKSWTQVDLSYHNHDKSKSISEINFGITGTEYHTTTSSGGVMTSKAGLNRKLSAQVMRASDGRLRGQGFPDGSNSGDLTIQDGWIINVGVGSVITRYKIIEITDTRLVVTEFFMSNEVVFQELTYTLTRPDGVLPGPLKPN